MTANLKDQSRTRHFEPDGGYRRGSRRAGASGARTCFMTDPSLSGRGSALNREQIGFPGGSTEKPDSHGPA
jgi:polyphosphate kinase